MLLPFHPFPRSAIRRTPASEGRSASDRAERRGCAGGPRAKLSAPGTVSVLVRVLTLRVDQRLEAFDNPAIPHFPFRGRGVRQRLQRVRSKIRLARRATLRKRSST